MPPHLIDSLWKGVLMNSRTFSTHISLQLSLNPLPDMPILDSSKSAANKDMISKIWTNGDTIIRFRGKH